MSFSAYETSIDQGEPILLFAFSVGATRFLYTTADRPITWNGETYDSVPISRSSVRQTQEVRQQLLRVTGPRDISIASVYEQEPPTIPVALTITMFHYTDSAAQGVVDWVGRVTSVKWRQSNIEFQCEPVYASVQTAGLRRTYQIGCSHVLYGNGCGLAKSNFAYPGSVQSVSGFSITSSAWATLPSGLSFYGGFVQWQSAQGYQESRTIASVSGSTLTLDNAFSDIVVGTQVIAYPGCARTTQSCQAFGNILNFGGMPYIPTVNPFNGNPVY